MRCEQRAVSKLGRRRQWIPCGVCVNQFRAVTIEFSRHTYSTISRLEGYGMIDMTSLSTSAIASRSCRQILTTGFEQARPSSWDFNLETGSAICWKWQSLIVCGELGRNTSSRLGELLPAHAKRISSKHRHSGTGVLPATCYTGESVERSWDLYFLHVLLSETLTRDSLFYFVLFS